MFQDYLVKWLNSVYQMRWVIDCGFSNNVYQYVLLKTKGNNSVINLQSQACRGNSQLHLIPISPVKFHLIKARYT